MTLLKRYFDQLRAFDIHTEGKVMPDYIYVVNTLSHSKVILPPRVGIANVINGFWVNALGEYVQDTSCKTFITASQITTIDKVPVE